MEILTFALLMIVIFKNEISRFVNRIYFNYVRIQNRQLYFRNHNVQRRNNRNVHVRRNQPNVRFADDISQD